MENTTLYAFQAYPMSAETTRYVLAVLSNDESSTDEELIDSLYVAIGDLETARQFVQRRDSFLNSI